MPIFNTKLLQRIEAQIEIPLSKRLPVLGVYSAQTNNNDTTITVITSIYIESFSNLTGFRKYYYKTSNDFRINCSDFCSHCSLGSCIFTGCSDGKVRIFSSKNLNLVSTILDNFEELQNITLKGNNNIQMTYIICPLNNAIICGYSDGSLKSFYLESKQFAGIYPYPFEYTLDTHSHPVSCLSFCKNKNYIIVGYFKRIDPDIQIENIPIVVYSLKKSSYIRHYSGARHTILSVELLEDQKYMIASTGRQILIWRYESLELFYTYDFAINIPNLFPQAHCIASTIVSSYGHIFASFDSGLLACLSLRLPGDTTSWVTPNIDNILQEESTLNDNTGIICHPYKLLQINSNDDSSEIRLIDNCARFLRFEASSKILLSGDYLARVNIFPYILLQTQHS